MADGYLNLSRYLIRAAVLAPQTELRRCFSAAGSTLVSTSAGARGPANGYTAAGEDAALFDVIRRLRVIFPAYPVVIAGEGQGAADATRPALATSVDNESEMTASASRHFAARLAA